MASNSSRSASSVNFPNRIGWPLGLWLAGLLAAFWPTWWSGFSLVQGGLGDTRLVNFILEHGYRWLMRLPLAQDLWSPPMFFPANDVAFYTDLVLGVAPLYWPWRWLGAGPHTAYQLWMLSCWSLNFLAAYLLLHRGLKLSRAGAAAGAYLFAFSSPRLAYIVHQQLNPQFFLLLSLGAVLALVKGGEKETRPRHSWLWVAALYGGLVLQIATAVYPLVFFALAVLVGLLAAVTFPDGRLALIDALRRHRWPLILGAMIALAVAAPLIAGYWDTASELGMRRYNPAKLPRPLSWMLPGPSNLLYGWVHRLPEVAWAGMPPHQNGVGVATLALSTCGLWLGRRRRSVQLAVLVVAVLFLVTLRMPGDWSLWRWARELVPGAAALRAIGRVGAMMLFPTALGLGLTVERVASRSRGAVVAAMVLVAAEQLHRPLAFDKAAAVDRVETIAAEVPRDSTAFLLIGETGPHRCCLHEDAAWAALISGVPTVNGRSGLDPPRWGLADVSINDADDERRIRERLELWCRTRAVNSAGVAWVVAPAPTLLLR